MWDFTPENSREQGRGNTPYGVCIELREAHGTRNTATVPMRGLMLRMTQSKFLSMQFSHLENHPPNTTEIRD